MRTFRQIKEICEKSRGQATISEAVPGNAEQNLTVGRPLDAVSKAFGLIVRCINDEPFEVPLVPSSHAVTIWFVVPNSQMGSVIGKAGSKIKEIQDMSSAFFSHGVVLSLSYRKLVISLKKETEHLLKHRNLGEAKPRRWAGS
ncbi:hypothetical protein PPACK8108_LOCUS25965 [Phakopsora pachyrhizi]|uniref:K Homology domain-containing protein n=1 Tax=Phakopsora pachyrhizi TaxID=170000 RepID=A0AAV0BSU9_PHAPC|nr:hypothetical protein PPACK8108_LOCUS25965 [Phakopsora pachyrhizi]